MAHGDVAPIGRRGYAVGVGSQIIRGRAGCGFLQHAGPACNAREHSCSDGAPSGRSVRTRDESDRFATVRLVYVSGRAIESIEVCREAGRDVGWRFELDGTAQSGRRMREPSQG